MRASLRVKITMLFLFVTSISLTLVGVSNYQTAKESILQSLKDNARAKSQMQSRELSTWLSTRLSEVKIISHTDLIREGNDMNRMEYLRQERSQTSGNFFSFGISDRDGQMLDVSGLRVDISNEPSFAKAQKGYDVISDPIPGKVAMDRPIITIQVPIYDYGFQNNEILYASILVDNVFNRFTENKEGLEGKTLIYKEDGTIIYHSEDSGFVQSNILDKNFTYSELFPGLEQQNGSVETIIDNERSFIFFSEVLGTQWHMAVSIPTKAFAEPLKKLFWTTALTVLITEIVLGVLMFIFLNKMLSHIRQILIVTENVAGGNLKVSPISFKSNDEIGSLAQSVNGMVNSLRNMFERLNAIINQNDYAIIVVDTDYKVTYFNKKAESILGYTAEEVIYKHNLFLWHDRQEIIQRSERLTAELGVRILPDISVFLTKSLRDHPEDYEWTFIHKDGSRFPVNLNVSPMRDQNGFVTGYVGIAHDIRLYKQTEETRNRLLSILDAAKDLIASVDERGNIFYINPAGMELLEIEELNSETKATNQYFSHDDLQVFIESLHILHKKGYWEHESILITRSGKSIPMSLVLVAHKDRRGKVYYSVIARDILEQKRIQAELVSAKLEADQANEAKSIFLARMSHEIRTPLNGIIGFAQLMMRTDMNDIQREYNSKMMTSSHTLLHILNDILDFSKVEAGKIQLEKTSFSLDENMRNIADMMSVLLGRKSVEIIIDTPEELPSALIGDPLRLEQVMLNLCSNALKFTTHGYILVKLDMIFTNEKEVNIEFSVEDSGIGMSQDQLAKLFAPFMQADESTSRKYGGTGLGLVISQNLIELMGGTLQVQSEPGKGSRFSFRIPFELAATTRTEKLKLPETDGLFRVLVVQENNVIRSKLCSMLESLSLEVSEAGSWEEGRKLMAGQAKDHAFHLVFLDMESEEMDCLDTWLQCRGMLQSVGSVSIVMTTIYGREEMQRMPKDERPDWIMVKPTNRLGLYQIVRAAIERLKTSQEVVQQPLPIPSKTIKAGSKGRILLAEDNEMNQMVAVEILKGEGYLVTVVSNGNELLQRLHLNPTGWDLILMDIQMPEKDGYEAAREIRADDRFELLPIIALTANVLPKEREACLAIGMNDVLNKPIDVFNISYTLDKWLRNSVHSPHRDRKVTNDQENEGSFAIPELNGIDVRRMLYQLDGKVPILLHMLGRFRKEYAEFMISLQGDIAQGKWEIASRKIHSLKGVAAYMAADSLLAAASSLEHSLIEQKEEPNLEQEVLNVKFELETILLSLEQSSL